MRPDQTQMRIMVPEHYIPVKEKKVFQTLYGDYFGKNFEGVETSWFKRVVHYFYPYYNYNPSNIDYEQPFDFTKDYTGGEFQNHYHFKI
jgi:hypothetical protein